MDSALAQWEEKESSTLDGEWSALQQVKKGPVHLKSTDGMEIFSDSKRFVSRWSEHSQKLLNVPDDNDHEALDNAPQRIIKTSLDEIPTIDEMLQEKCIEQDRPLYMVFVDFSKAFDTVGRTGLWQLLRKYGCPEKFTSMIEALHTGMMANKEAPVDWTPHEDVTRQATKADSLLSTGFWSQKEINGEQ
ncbi:hypothetical protein NP493_66g06009 [Ridgeia piscesae]|uniref:Reverse transcriptase domain-containing protein n=1 Tax=Ridgeia piscesae TaxID=27915 RepID=A0AAD9UIV7_RIDPI|nr:hypothetical protein NP493_66g06009 [Ridgeia piscesae]